MQLGRLYTLVGSATLASRLSGFVRDILIAAVLGSSAVADAYIAAFLLPNLFRRVLSEGAFNTAYVPIHARRLSEGGIESAERFAEAALSSLVAFVLIGLVLAEAGMPLIITALAPGFSAAPQKFADAVLFARIAFVFVGAIVVVAFLSSRLNAIGRYGLVALAPLVLNLILIPVLIGLLAIGWRGEARAGLALVSAVLAAGVIQLAYLAWGVRRAGLSLRLTRPGSDPDVRRLLILILPGLILAGAGHFNMVVAAQLSSGLPAAISWLYYADRLFQLPLGFIAAAIGVVLLPEVARALREGEPVRAEAAINRALEFGLMFILPASVGLMVLAVPIVDIIYRHGVFTAQDSRATADVLTALALGLPGFVLVKVFLPPWLARESVRVPIVAALAGILANVAVTTLALPALAHGAAPLGVAVSAWVNAAVLGLTLGWTGGLALDAAARRALPRILLATALTAALTVVLATWAGPLLAPQMSFALRVTVLLGLCGTVVVAHVALAHVLGIADLKALAAWMQRRGA